jgi:hypothetical protein
MRFMVSHPHEDVLWKSYTGKLPTAMRPMSRALQEYRMVRRIAAGLLAASPAA